MSSLPKPTDPNATLPSEAPGALAGDAGPIEAAVLFVDLVNSSVFASVLGLKEYADYLGSFHEMCISQCAHFFDVFLEGRYRQGRDYRASIIGDELLVTMYTGKGHNDVYLLTCLAAVLKAAWLVSPANIERLQRKTPVGEISGGIHHGPVWAVPADNGYDFAGYALNLAKRVESHSRTGNHYRIFLSDQAFKQIHFRQRNLIFAPGQRFDPKGIFGHIICHELAHSFLNPVPRMTPVVSKILQDRLVDLIQPAFQDLWVHDMYQVWSESTHKGVTDECMNLCRNVLRHSPDDPVSLYHLAQAYRERGDQEAAILLSRELCAAWPQFADGHLELGKALQVHGDAEGANTARCKARILGLEEPSGAA